MKKKIQNNIFGGKIHNNMFAVIATIFILLLPNLLHASNQDLTVNVKLKNVTIMEVIEQISKQTKYAIVFNKEEIPTSPKISIEKKATVESILKECLPQFGLKYEYKGNSIFISKIEAPQKQPQQKNKDLETINIKGRVVDSDKKGMSGVMVLILNSSKGTIADENGNFAIQATIKDKLEFTFVGFKTEVVSVSKQDANNMLVMMEADAVELDDVVVVAYGTQRKESLVGSVTTVNTRNLKSSSSDLTSTLAGNVAGVIGWQTGGIPGAMTDEEMNTKFYVRGITSFQTGANIDPLILIDGVESSKLDLSRMAVEDIESFSVMKDASATAMYGARGANGVILVTTKKGEAGSVYTTARYEVVASRPTREIDIVDSKDYMRMYNNAIQSRNPNLPVKYDIEKIDRTGSTDFPSYVYPNNDWYDILFEDFSINHRAGVNIRGGSRLVQYYASLNYNRDEGMLKTDRLNQFKCNIENNSFAFRTNLNIDLTTGIRLNVNVAANYDKNRGPLMDMRDAYYQAFIASPVDYAPIYPADDEFGWSHIRFGGTGIINKFSPYLSLHRGYKERTRFATVARAEYIQNLSSLAKGLEVRASLALNQVGFRSTGYTTNPYEYRLDPLFGHNGYDFETGKHKLISMNPKASRTLVKHEGECFANQSVQVAYEAQILHVAAWGDHQTSLTAVFNGRELTETSVRGESTLLSFPKRNLGLSMRGTYGYKDRYFVEASFGYNGSERFADKHRFGFFPAFGGAWVVSKENFFVKNTSKWLDFLKFRLSWGQVGNDGVIRNPRFAHLPDLKQGSHAAPFYGDGSVITYSVLSYPNDKITWEIAEQTNIGIETKLFKGLLDFNVDIYQEIRRNILDLRRTMPSTTGLETLQLGNVGTAKSRGIDISAKIQKSFSNGFWIILNGTLTYNKAKFDEIEEATNKPIWQRKTGQEISQSVGYIAEGLFRDEEEIRNSPKQGGNVMPGDIRYRDLNKDGIIDINDATYIGFPSTPRLIYGFNAMLNYKQFELSFAFQGSGKRAFFMDPMKMSPFVDQRAMLTAIYEDHWSPDNMSERPFWPRLSHHPINEHNPQEEWSPSGATEVRKSTYFMRESSFIRCTSIELAYNVPNRIMKKFNFQNMKIYGRVNNPFLISSFKVWDVELGDNGFNYPIQRTWSVGINVSF